MDEDHIDIHTTNLITDAIWHPGFLAARVWENYITLPYRYFFFFSSRRRHTRFDCDWSSDVCSSDLDRDGRDRRVYRRRRAPRPALAYLSGGHVPQHVARRRGRTEHRPARRRADRRVRDRKSTRLNSSHSQISYAAFCLKKKINRILSAERLGPRTLSCRQQLRLCTIS